MRDLTYRRALVNDLSGCYRSYVGFLVKWAASRGHKLIMGQAICSLKYKNPVLPGPSRPGVRVVK
jgi:hypothetical protein